MVIDGGILERNCVPHCLCLIGDIHTPTQASIATHGLLMAVGPLDQSRTSGGQHRDVHPELRVRINSKPRDSFDLLKPINA